MRVLVNLYGELAAYKATCIEYIDNVGESKEHGLYIETADRDSDKEWVLVRMDNDTAYNFIRTAVIDGYIDVSDYLAYNVVDDAIVEENSCFNVIDNYFSKMNITTESEKAYELKRLFDLFGTEDIDIVARNLKFNLM